MTGASLALSALSMYMDYSTQRRWAKRRGEQAKEREKLELRLEQERIDYEANLAAEQAAWEIKVSLEKTEYTRKRIQEEADLVQAAQIVGYAASGVETKEGSPLRVMSETARQAEMERYQVLRGHEIFSEARLREAEEVKLGGEATYAWFTERLHTETGYEVESRYAEAAQFRTQATLTGFGGFMSVGTSLLSEATMGSW